MGLLDGPNNWREIKVDLYDPNAFAVGYVRSKWWFRWMEFISLFNPSIKIYRKGK